MKKLKYLMIGSIGGLTLGLLAAKSMKNPEDPPDTLGEMKNKFHSSSLDELLKKLEDLDFQALSKTVRSKIREKIEELNGLLA